MAQNTTPNTSDVKANMFAKGMNKDVADIYMSNQAWTHAVNAINNSHLGEQGTLSNEPANYNAAIAPYTIIGAIHKSGTEWIIFSTNNYQSEIGIFDEVAETYQQLVNNNCLGFKKTNLITGVSKENYDCTRSVYFQDGLNPDRVLNLDRIPYKTTGNNLSEDPDCFIPEYTPELDCDALRLHPLVTQACVNVRRAQGGGQLNNGSYMACIAYSENGIRLTDYSMPSTPVGMWDHEGIGGSLEIKVDNLDQDFEEYELVVVSVTKQNAVAKKIGNFPIRQSTVTLDNYSSALETVPITTIPLRNVVYERSDKMHKVGEYLIRTGVTTQPYFNYQALANQISTKWVAVEYASDYYWGAGTSLGYMRDEVYSFFIRWVYKTGARSASFHIPGRAATSSDLEVQNGADVIYSGQNKRWQVYDTSTKVAATGETSDGDPIIFRGKMGYWESVNTYPDDKPEIWGDLCGKPIRHHKMPSNETMHIHSQGGDKIYVLGVEFSNIAHPVDQDGNPLTDVVGYEILRGSREGNRSIVAKGMFNNMWEYTPQSGSATNKKGLYQNYPYNDLRPDPFLTPDFSALEIGGSDEAESSPKLSTYRKDYFSFHSPETAFIRPYLGANYVRIYTEERGTVTGSFQTPYKHPKHKMLTDGAFGTAVIVGLGVAAVIGLGSTTVTGGNQVGAALGGFVHAYGAKQSGEASAIGDLAATAGLQAVTTGAQGSLGATAAGVALMIGQMAYYGGMAIDQVLRAIFAMGRYRDYMLQYNSHGFYHSYSNVTNSASGTSAPSFTRLVADNGAKYVGAALQDFDATYRINNNNRNKFVGIKVTADVSNPQSITDSSRKRVADVGGSVNHKTPFGAFNSTTVAYYGAIKLDYQNQYGLLESIVQIPVNSCVYPSTADVTTTSSTNVIFGGDVYINRYTEKNPFYFFNNWLMGEPDGTDMDYRMSVNGPCPRYWVNLAKYDLTDFAIEVQTEEISFLGISINKPTGLNLVTPSDFHRFDRGGNTGAFLLRNVWAYLFYNGVRDFFCESELNMAYRDYGEDDREKFYDVYGNSFNDLSTMFRSDLIKSPIYAKYDTSLSASKLFNNTASWGSVLPRDYDPALYTSCFEYFPNRAVYSLQQQSGMRRDNWRNYLPLNYKDFKGRISTIKSLNAQGAIILFEDAEPVQFSGTDQLQTKGGTKFTIGDGGLFQQNAQSVVNADDALDYASCISSRSAVNTPYGMFFISQKTGKIMQYGGSGVSEISRDGLKFWFNEHLPSRLLEAYPDFPLYDNPVAGIGCQTMYDQQYELLYFSKKDFVPKRRDLYFDDPTGVPYYICGQTVPPPIPPVDPVITAITGLPQPSSSCLLDIVFAVDVSGSTSNGGIKQGEIAFVKGFLENPAIAAAMASGDIQVGFTQWSAGSNVSSMNPNGFSMSNTITPTEVETWYDTTWLGGGTNVQLGLTHAQPILNDKANSELGDRTSNPNFKQILIFVTDTQNESGAVSGVGNPYQSITIPANSIGNPSGPANQFIYAAFCAATTDIPNNPIYLQRISATDGAINQPGGYNYGINASSPESINQVATAIASSTCTPSLACNFQANTEVFTEGEQVLLTWTTVSAATAQLEVTYTSTGNTQTFPAPTDGSAVVVPLADETIYSLILDDGKGNLSNCTLILTPRPRDPIFKKCPCAFDNPDCFEPCNWTVSYDPKTKQWISFHSWTPDLNMPAYEHFFTIKGDGIWKHNAKWDLFTEYYGQQKGWEVEFPVVNASGVTTLRSVEYWMEAYKYYNNGVDYNHVLDENFDTAIIYNSEQNSGILKLNVKPKNDPYALVAQPVITQYNMEILVAKEENKYRFNQFWDNTNDRGEFTFNQTPMWITNCNGYQRTVNPQYINYDKPALERKKFRHYGNRVVLRKTASTDKKMILKVGMTKHLNSPR